MTSHVVAVDQAASSPEPEVPLLDKLLLAEDDAQPSPSFVDKRTQTYVILTGLLENGVQTYQLSPSTRRLRVLMGELMEKEEANFDALIDGLEGITKIKGCFVDEAMKAVMLSMADKQSMGRAPTSLAFLRHSVAHLYRVNRRTSAYSLAKAGAAYLSGIHYLQAVCTSRTLRSQASPVMDGRGTNKQSSLALIWSVYHSSASSLLVLPTCYLLVLTKSPLFFCAAHSFYLYHVTRIKLKS